MITYNPNYLDNRDIFTPKEIKSLEELNQKVSLKKFLNNKSYIDKFGLDFIYSSALIEGNTYDKLDTQALIEYGRTAGGKKYSDAKMILNLRDAYEIFITGDLKPSKQSLKDLHYILSAEMIPEHKRATPRDGEVTILGCNYIPLATKEKLDDELNYLFKIADTIKNPFDKALYIHNNLAYLQYFTDCNKRTARLMLNVVLKEAQKMIYIPDEESIKEYLKSIVAYYETGNYTLFKKYFINSYKKVIEMIVEIEESRKNERSLRE
ncbi:Huntingtin interacting protein E-like protein [hydrothermal vent metagenome]|uniref:Huntingtin interacting protein E-like protein n=1 Tax=hydrothermal vent metagenome TaxID=652676 RepID=A0A1W1BCX5_9ZZZZ